jgi:CheY-like chemotaxis protein
MLAHELRNPLSAIVNAVGILDRTSTQDATSVRARKLVRRQTDHLARLLDDLLDVARISRGRIGLREEPLDLAIAAGRAVDEYRHRIVARDQHLTVALPDTPVAVRGDPARLQQVIANLLSNACKYTAPGGAIWLTLTTEGAHAVLRVRDNGRGIPPELLGSVFDAFMQVSPGLARTEGGLGIGLTLVKRLVELHGGSIEARSEGRGAGAEFIVRLPLTGALPLPDERPPGASMPQRIVVIEDNDDAREALVTALKLAGHEVRAARTGEEGLELAPQVAPHIVLIDIGLPDMDGYEVARSLRHKLPVDTRLVALTGYGQAEDRRRSAAAGFDHHLVKPVAAEDIVRILSR